MKPLIGLTMGDPAGVGPEIILRVLRSRALRSAARFVVFGNRPSFDHVSRAYKWNTDWRRTTFVETSPWLKRAPHWGKASADGGKSAGEALRVAIDWAMNNKIHAIVTAPINKAAFKQGGWGRYPGHTEMLTALTRARESALMMVYKHMRVVHVTSHIPLRLVTAQLSAEKIYKTILLTNQALRDLGVARPRIAVCGVNPHAGDDGVLGNEDARLIAPAVARARRRGLRVDGPLSADALWPAVWAKKFDAGVAMYHDQGQIPMKLLAFHENARSGDVEPHGVNVTVGLPIVRTSVAHGTAYTLAGKNRASSASLVEAIDLAIRLAQHRAR
jgi:4-hydroxythreonine-4-phosphate dehydrogenase